MTAGREVHSVLDLLAVPAGTRSGSHSECQRGSRSRPRRSLLSVFSADCPLETSSTVSDLPGCPAGRAASLQLLGPEGERKCRKLNKLGCRCFLSDVSVMLYCDVQDAEY